MRKKIIYTIGTIFVFFCFYLVAIPKVNIVFGANNCPAQCTSWCTESYSCNDPYGNPGFCSKMYCCAGGTISSPPWCPTVCGPGTYPCNSGTNCCPIGPTPPPGPGGGTPAPTGVGVAPTPFCTLTLSPSTASLTVGSAATLTATIGTCNVPVDNVTFSSSNATVTSVAPASVVTTTPPFNATYSTVATANLDGVVTITAQTHTSGNIFGTATATITSIPPNPWWQVKDGDVTSGGDLTSKVYAANHFDINGAGGYPGVPSYQGTTDLTISNVSATGWLLQNTMTNPKVFDYQSFINQIPSSTIINTLNSSSITTQLNNGGFGTKDASTGYYWYKYTGPVDLTVSSAVNVGSAKVILLVDSADFLINAPINLTDGSGFFMVLVGKNSGGTKGNIVVGSTVGGGAGPNLEGIYFADESFSDSIGSNQLWVRGSVVAYGGVSLLRDLVNTNTTTPAELFEYAPDQILLFPQKFGVRRINWKEVAP